MPKILLPFRLLPMALLLSLQFIGNLANAFATARNFHDINKAVVLRCCLACLAYDVDSVWLQVVQRILVKSNNDAQRLVNGVVVYFSPVAHGLTNNLWQSASR